MPDDGKFESWDINGFQEGFSFSETLGLPKIFVKQPIENLIESALIVDSF